MYFSITASSHGSASPWTLLIIGSLLLFFFCGEFAVMDWLVAVERPKLFFSQVLYYVHLAVSKNRGTPKSSILIGFFIIHHPFLGTPIFGNTHLCSTVLPRKKVKRNVSPSTFEVKLTSIRSADPIVAHSITGTRLEPRMFVQKQWVETTPVI